MISAKKLYERLTPLLKQLFKIEEIIWINKKDFDENANEIREQCKIEKVALIVTTEL